MLDKILCPWCGAEMEINTKEFNRRHSARMECNNSECNARGPMTKWHDTEEKAIESARAAALRCYTPLLKPLTLEASIEEKAVWIEQETNEPENNLTPSLFGWQNKGRWVVFIEQPGEDDDDGGKIVGYNPFDYGRTWRCWPRKPTKDEMEAAKWEK